MNFDILELELQKFDFTYEMSDDGRVWRQGVKEQERVQKLVDDLACINPEKCRVLIKRYQHPTVGARFKVNGGISQ